MTGTAKYEYSRLHRQRSGTGIIYEVIRRSDRKKIGILRKSADGETWYVHAPDGTRVAEELPDRTTAAEALDQYDQAYPPKDQPEAT